MDHNIQCQSQWFFSFGEVKWLHMTRPKSCRFATWGALHVIDAHIFVGFLSGVVSFCQIYFPLIFARDKVGKPFCSMTKVITWLDNHSDTVIGFLIEMFNKFVKFLKINLSSESHIHYAYSIHWVFTTPCYSPLMIVSQELWQILIVVLIDIAWNY